MSATKQPFTEVEWQRMESKVRQMGEFLRRLGVRERYGKGDRVRALTERFARAVEKMENTIENYKPRKDVRKR